MTRLVPDESLASLRRATKRITMMLAGYLAYEVAAILREILTHPTKQFYDDTTAHLLCSNYWIKPIYQELLHSSSRYNATLTGERKRPCSGLARVTAHPRPAKTRRQTPTTATDWFAMLTLYRSGSQPIGHRLSFDNCKEEKMSTGLRTLLGLIKQQSRITCTRAGRMPDRAG